MIKINTRQIAESPSESPKGKFARSNQDLSIALGRDPLSTDPARRHPFDVQICRIPSGKIRGPFHFHTAQWEFFHVISGTGSVRHKDGVAKIEQGDAFIFAPEEPHQFINDGAEDLVLYIVADNPIGESCYYPDSKKWAISSPSGGIFKSERADYFDGEE